MRSAILIGAFAIAIVGIVFTLYLSVAGYYLWWPWTGYSGWEHYSHG